MKGKLLVRDGLIILSTIIAAVFVTKYELVDALVSYTKDYYLLSIFVTGVFFTSIFTTAPAIAVLISLGVTHSPILVALLGGLGALCGDLIMFRFMKKDVTEDLDFVLSRAKSKRLKHIIQLKAFKWFLTSLGALVIASPLPDELGLALMGISRVSLSVFIPISFIFNSLGIYVITSIANSL